MENTDKSTAQDIAAKEWNDSFDYRSLRNGVQVGNIKMIHLDGVNKRAMDIYAAQQLSEYKERLKNSLLSWASVGRGKDSEDLINYIVILIDKL